MDQHHPPRSGSVRAAPGVADGRDPIARPPGRVGGDRAARGRWCPAVRVESPPGCASADAARDGLRLPDRLQLRPAVRVRAGNPDARTALDRDPRGCCALRHARRRPDGDRGDPRRRLVRAAARRHGARPLPRRLLRLPGLLGTGHGVARRLARQPGGDRAAERAAPRRGSRGAPRRAVPPRRSTRCGQPLRACSELVARPRRGDRRLRRRAAQPRAVRADGDRPRGRRHRQGDRDGGRLRRRGDAARNGVDPRPQPAGRRRVEREDDRQARSRAGRVRRGAAAARARHQLARRGAAECRRPHDRPHLGRSAQSATRSPSTRSS